MHPFRSVLAAALVGLMALTLSPVASPASADHHNGAAPGPIHAGNTFGWYQHGVFRQEFIGPKPGYWKKSGRGIVRTQNGMLTLMTTRKGSVAATLDLPGHTYGRWEIRMRARRMDKTQGGKDYKVVTELVPAGSRDQHCGGRDIGVQNFTVGTNTVKSYVHTLPNSSYRGFHGRHLKNDRWHTYAVEVAEDHISWFVDAHVINTERRPEALDPVRRQLRFELRARDGATMHPARMQMDWMRYWTMRAPNERSIKAPPFELSSFPAAC
ncbi:glycoside hydrolase family 16 protein [Nocardioides sp. zg-1308]|uniref:glycoside hydrolase family 16 protein n=1 Tax=Nocardioides sp. zg-1308 TaxID=2736253 RepID=UPI001557F7FF|nr:glycoside hydrolase family 16 protein [Nocardioides sp. zg-1308]NPD06792.1 glycoside hydrolase family 16 protein [Nocardioides sp. zg-1308]